MKALIGGFVSPEDAGEAVTELLDAGFDSDEIHVLAQEGAVDNVIDDERGESAKESAGAGALGGTAVGGLIGLIAGASALVIPGVGPALAAGAWASVLGTAAAGAGVGAAYGGFVGALIGFGVAEERTHLYVETVERGGVLILLQPTDPEQLEMGENIMERHSGIGVDEVEIPEEA